ncbi:MAG: transglutaminase domain-containing protein [Akkermansia sp.]|nr:transglutaminase domain-containing protein [Akkermansia sp.]
MSPIHLLILLILLLPPLAATEYSPPWQDNIPADVRENALLPDQVLTEEPAHWRPVLEALFRPQVAHCRSAREAVLHIASRFTPITGVYYSTARRKHDMNALEALAEKKVSCTGQSILLVCALRSVGIPARAVGILTWNHIPGNHTWAEAWFEGEWHMIEPYEKNFNTPWVMEYIGMLNPRHPYQRIMAAWPAGKENFHPVPLAPGSRNIPAQDVTERYMALSSAWYASQGNAPEYQKLYIDRTPRSNTPEEILLENAEGTILSRAELPTSRHDMRYRARLLLPRKGTHFLRHSGTATRIPIQATPPPVQLLDLH